MHFRRMSHRPTFAAIVLFVLAATGAHAQTDAGGTPASSRARLREYQGVYDYQRGSRIAIVAADSILYAVLDEAKYPLRPLGDDRFRNAGGDTIPFNRSAGGVVTGFTERGVTFGRRTPTVDQALVSAVLAKPRPLGANGRPAAYVYHAPAELHDGIRVGDVKTAGLDTSFVARLVGRVADGTYPDVHSILVHRSGRLVAEEYFYEYDRERLHQMRSASKSVVSALVGIAIDRGALSSDTELVTKRLPYERYENPDPRKDSLTFRDLLTMRSGLACDDWNGDSPGNESKVYQSADWVKFVLDLPMIERPGTKGSYCSGGVAVMGRIVERATGSTVPVFAQQHLFAPLGIRARDVRWNYTLSASNAETFAQVYMRPRDMLKLGLLFAQHGSWNGRQVISRAWVDRSTSKWSAVGDQEYGYFWWHQWVDAATPTGMRRVDMVLASGNGGQKIYIVPSLDLVVVVTGGNYNTQSPSTAIMKELLSALLRHPSS